MEDKIILSIGGILMLGFVVITGIDQPCMQDGQVMLSPAVVVEVEPYKICFELEDDYLVYRNDVLKKLKDQQEFIYEDAILMLSEEVNRGNVDIDNLKTDQGVAEEIGQLILDNNIVQFPKK